MPWADLSDVRMYYELAGSGEPVLFIPGLGATCRLWDPIIPELSRDYSLILPDNRGVGKSVAKRPLKTLRDLSSDLLELLDTLQLERAHVVGISFGGVIAQSLAVDHPGRVDRLVLMSTTHRFGPYLRQIAMLLGHTLRKFPLKLFLETMELLGTGPTYFDAKIDEIQANIKARNSAGSRGPVAAQLRCLSASEFNPRDYRIEAPTLVLSGEYDPLIPNCYAKQMADEIPGSRFVVLRGCGHNPVSEDPAAVAQAMASFFGEAIQADSTGLQFASGEFNTCQDQGRLRRN